MLNNVAKQWIEALRSGKYTQESVLTRDRCVLRTLDDKFDPMGVLCELAVSAELIPAPIKGYFGYHYGDNAVHYDVKVQKWAALNNRAGFFLPSDSIVKQHSEGKTFAEIADIIESDPEGLFV